MVADALIWAAKRGDLVALETAIGSAVDLNAKDSQGWTALFHAAHNGNTKALQLLIGAGAEVNRGKETGFTALFAAVGAGHVDAVRLLLDAGAEIVQVKGVELRGYCIRGNSERHKAILALLDGHQTKKK
jgi:ankyrin repeat protein